MRRLVPALAVLVVLAGCGNEKAAAPDVTTPGPPLGSNKASYPEHGIAFSAPAGWTLDKGTAPLVATAQTGRATIAIWRYPRTEPLPKTKAQLRAARDALVAAAKGRDPTFTAEKAKVVRVAGNWAVQIRGSETILGQPRAVRSTHIYANNAEIVIDAYSPVDDFDRLDRAAFRPLNKSLRLSAPKPVQ